MGERFSPRTDRRERIGELDLDQMSGGAEATDTAPPGGLGSESAVIALMLEAAPIGELRMLSTRGITT